MNTFNSRNILAAAAVSIIAGLAFNTSSVSAASYDNLNKCHFATKEKVIKCCETIVRKKGMPRWIIETGNSCRTIVVCKRSRAVTHVAKNRCFIQRRNKAPRSDSLPVRELPRQRQDFNPAVGGKD